MSDFEKILEQNWQRRRWKERAAAAKRREADRRADERKRAGRYEGYRWLCLFFSMAAGTAAGFGVVLSQSERPLGCFAAWIAAFLLAALALTFDELREESRDGKD